MEWLWSALATAALGGTGYFVKEHTNLLRVKPDWKIEKRPGALRVTRTASSTAFSTRIITFADGLWEVEPRPVKGIVENGESDIKRGEHFDIPFTSADSIRIDWVAKRRWRSDTVLRGDITNSEKPIEVIPHYLF